jgi:hypothetical protein
MGKQPSQNLGSMTVNERLTSVGLMDRWDAAVRDRDREEMLRIMEQVEVANPAFTVDTILSNPKKYGY